MDAPAGREMAEAGPMKVARAAWENNLAVFGYNVAASSE
jgi:hypothetical protein